MLEALIALIIALAVVGFVYWVVITLIGKMGVPFPPQTTTVVQILFAIIGVMVLLKYGRPLLDSLV